ncbi:MAG: phosphate signaling complex protein PhoU [Methanosarcinales archaeon]|nr:phosphate signaling complex protein PhoU [Methanosarcinales archaeon]
MNPYRQRYHNDLADLKTMTEELVTRVDAAIGNSLEALSSFDVEIARGVIQEDHVVDDLSLKLENKCMELLALQQPMAKDLRLIIAIIKIGIDLERIGDMAVDLARITIQSRNKVHVKKLVDIPRMGEVARMMLSLASRALEENDADLARQATKWDYEIDSLYVRVRDNLLKIIAENPVVIDDATSMLLANRHLERIGDHICNICESIIYMIEAKREHLN